jgi:HK97 family phage portal protein
MGILDRFKTKDTSVSEKNYGRTGPNGTDTLEGYFPTWFNPNGWFQEGYSPGMNKSFNPDIAAAISLYKRAFMAVPAKHISRNPDGAGVTINDTTALSRVIRRPNQYMSWAEFVGIIVDGLLRKGEFACYIEEDGRGMQTTIHPLNNFQMVAADDGSIFYRVAFSEAQKYLGEEWNDLYIPQRYVVHGRFEVDPQNHLRALSPLQAYAHSIGLGSVLRAGQESFHSNKSQPSGVLTTDASLTSEQATQLRSRWNEMSQRMKQGETPILSNGLKWQPVSVSANEAQVIQLLGLTTKDICKAYGIPPILLGENTGVTYSNLEQLLFSWRTTGLLSVAIVIEQAFEHSFYLDKNDEMVLDISDLARAEALQQADTLTRLVQNGIIKPNEARAKLDLAPLEGVANTLVAQQQIQPLQQNADLAIAAANREDKKIEIQRTVAENPPQVAEPKENEKPADDKSVDVDALELMLKGILK